MSRSTSLLTGLVGAIAVAAACSASGDGTGFTNAGGNASAGPSNGGAGGGDVGGGFVTSATSSGTGPGTCTNTPEMDGDNDGWTGAEGDCNDCDPNVNPGAVDVVATGPGAPISDENCDGMLDNVPLPCDQGLALGDVDPMNGARAIELCQTTTPNAPKKDKKWGVLEAKYVRADGTSFNPGLQVGLVPSWGTNVHVQGGQRMLAMSSGYARALTDPGACGSLTCSSNLFGNPPAGFPQDNPNCPPSTEINDDVGLQVKIRSPTNATGYSFNFKFYSFEYPEWVCNSYNDQFIALVAPPPAGSINGNISFDSNNNAVSVNIAFFDVCNPADIGEFAFFCGGCAAPPNPYCPSGTAELVGTGFDAWDNAGATSWLKSQAPVKGGSDVSIRFAIWDTGDEAYDSTALIDNFQWIATGGDVTVQTDPVGTPK